MEKYPKLFVKAGIIYLAVGVLVGLMLSFNPVLGINPVFVHVHLNLLGFMAFVIFGIGYHILPRFNARPVAYPRLIPIHFYLANIGLVGLVSAYILSATFFFALFSVVSAGSVLLFVINILPVLGNSPAEDVVKTAGEGTPVIHGKKQGNFSTISEEEKFGAVLDALPGLASAMEEFGFRDVSNPAFRAGFAKIVSIRQACVQSNISVEAVMKKINEVALEQGYRSENEVSGSAKPAEKEADSDGGEGGVPTTPTLKRGDLCRGDVFIGDLLSVYPETKKIIEKHYGTGCFSCPGQANETIRQSTLMHGIELDGILAEINSEIKKNTLGAHTA